MSQLFEIATFQGIGFLKLPNKCSILNMELGALSADLCDEALDVPGLGPLAALDEVVCRAVADDEEQEAAGVSVLVFLCELPLQVVHLLAVQVLIDLNIEPCNRSISIRKLGLVQEQ